MQSCRTDAMLLWEHEWHKHGTCAMAADLIDGRAAYFAVILDLNQKLSIEVSCPANTCIRSRQPPSGKRPALSQ